MLPEIIEGILFAHRFSRYSSTKCSPFMPMYNREPVLPIDVKHNLVKDESKKRENREGDGDEEQPFELDFLMPSFHQRRKSKQQSRIIQLTILKLLRKNKNETMIVDICLKQKLRWMMLCYYKTTNDLIGAAGSFHKNGLVLTLLWISLTKELQV